MSKVKKVKNGYVPIMLGHNFVLFLHIFTNLALSKTNICVTVHLNQNEKKTI